MIIGTVVEGPTDRMVIETVVAHLCPGEHRFLPLQPKSSDTFDEMGTGWKGVRSWCREVSRGSDEAAQLNPEQRWTRFVREYGPALDLLIIHVDADVAGEPNLQEGNDDPVQDPVQPCPPIRDTVDHLQQVVARWMAVMDPADLPGEVVFAIPSQDTENWTFAALYPGDPLCADTTYECIKPTFSH